MNLNIMFNVLILLLFNTSIHAISAEKITLEKNYFEKKLFYELLDQDVESLLDYSVSNLEITLGGVKLQQSNFNIAKDFEIKIPNQLFNLDDRESLISLEFTSKRGDILISIPFQTKLDKLQIQKLPNLEPIKFCISQKKINIQLCSNYFIIENNQIKQANLNNEKPGRIIINNQELANTGMFPVHFDQEYKIYAESGVGLV